MVGHIANALAIVLASGAGSPSDPSHQDERDGQPRVFVTIQSPLPSHDGEIFCSD